MTKSLLLWGAIFGVGVYVGVQIAKQKIESDVLGGMDKLFRVTGLSNTTYGNDVKNAANQFIDDRFRQ